ncbi:MAG: amidohydrolase family protein [Myxococcales bacterium]|nr:amidohydrolase family protein [Myxococcales bacterium]
MPIVTRRNLIVLVSGATLFSGFRFGHARLARQAAPSGPLSDEAQALIARAWRGLDPAKVLDTHVHVVGLGTGDTGCTVGARMQSMSNPAEYFKFSIYLNASGVSDLSRADQQYVERLSGLVSSQRPHGRLLLFAFDRAYDDAGQPLPDDTEFFTPVAYVASLAKARPDLFVACASVHPYRADAVEALEQAAALGCVAVKWLPNAMNIDPSSARCDASYEAMARLGLTLITHAGEEKAVHSEERQRLGNPLLLRRALEHGVKTVVAHCASLGQNPDLDVPEKPMVDNFDLFMRLMHETKWKGLLFGESSALTLVNRVGRPLETVLRDAEVQARMVNGSDYPLPAINALMQTSAIVKSGFLSDEERALLNEIDRHDPLLFDFVMKRTLRLKTPEAEHRLADSIFMPGPEVFPRLALLDIAKPPP